MFDFKVHYWDDQLYIDGRAYQSNEILTAYLNAPNKKLAGYLRELRELRQKTQLMEGGDETFCRNYDGYVQRAQQLLFYVGNIIKSLPPYNKLRSMAKLDSPLLFDCLNSYWGWENGDDGTHDDDFIDPDYSNEFGFVEPEDEYGRHNFYVHHFLPDYRDLDIEDNNYDSVSQIQRLNDSVCALFDHFITAAEDILRVQTAYAELLDGYIHAERKYLSNMETANAFTAYLKSSEKNSRVERVCSTGTMRLSYEVYRRKDGLEKLCETYEFDSLGAFFYVDFFKGMARNFLPRRCDNCGKWFLLTGGKYSNYCERPLKDDREKTCRDIGSRKRYDDKCKTDPIWLTYNRAYKAHYARYMKKKMTTAQFEQWSRYAVELREKAEAETLSYEEYYALIRK